MTPATSARTGSAPTPCTTCCDPSAKRIETTSVFRTLTSDQPFEDQIHFAGVVLQIAEERLDWRFAWARITEQPCARSQRLAVFRQRMCLGIFHHLQLVLHIA